MFYGNCHAPVQILYTVYPVNFGGPCNASINVGRICFSGKDDIASYDCPSELTQQGMDKSPGLINVSCEWVYHSDFFINQYT